MRKILPIIVGLVVGIASGAMMISADRENTAYGIGDTWSTYNFFEWNEIFTPSSQGQNLYNLVYNKRLVVPENEAIKEIAKQYGLTQEEARQAVDGSISIVLRGPGARSSSMSQEDAFNLIVEMQEDYEFLSTVFELEQEVDLSIAPSELFSNGDVFDSGFDLVHDLKIIEEILFVQTTENTVGQPFDGLPTSPYLPTGAENDIPFIADENPAAVVAFPGAQGPGSVSGGLVSSSSSEDSGEGSSAGVSEQEPSFVVSIGDSNVPVNILDEDICDPTHEDYADLLATFEAEKNSDNGAGQAGNGSGGANGGNGGSNSGAGGNTDSNGFSGGDGLAFDEDGDVLAVEPEDWTSEWCPGLSVQGGSSGKNLAMLGFQALGSGDISAFNPGVAESFSAESFVGSVHAAFCLETEIIMQRVSIYNPGDGCVACEVETINEYLEKTLSHSLVPNKVTGNMMETAKCKDGYDAGLDMQFITIASPVPTPPNDKIIGDPNIIEEWNRFANENAPFAAVDDPVSNFKVTYAPDGSNQTEIVAEIAEQQAKDLAAAQSGLEKARLQSDLGNTLVYGQEVLKEMKQMNNYFRNFTKIYGDVDKNACEELKKKPNLD